MKVVVFSVCLVMLSTCLSYAGTPYTGPASSCDTSSISANSLSQFSADCTSCTYECRFDVSWSVTDVGKPGIFVGASGVCRHCPPGCMGQEAEIPTNDKKCKITIGGSWNQSFAWELGGAATGTFGSAWILAEIGAEIQGSIGGNWGSATELEFEVEITVPPCKEVKEEAKLNIVKGKKITGTGTVQPFLICTGCSGIASTRLSSGNTTGPSTVVAKCDVANGSWTSDTVEYDTCSQESQ